MNIAFNPRFSGTVAVQTYGGSRVSDKKSLNRYRTDQIGLGPIRVDEKPPGCSMVFVSKRRNVALLFFPPENRVQEQEFVQDLKRMNAFPLLYEGCKLDEQTAEDANSSWDFIG